VVARSEPCTGGDEAEGRVRWGSEVAMPRRCLGSGCDGRAADDRETPGNHRQEDSYECEGATRSRSGRLVKQPSGVKGGEAICARRQRNVSWHGGGRSEAFK